MSDMSMTPERWQRLRRLFAEAQTLAPDARDSWLDEQCSDDPQLREQLLQLLDGDGYSDSNLVNVVARAARGITAEVPEELQDVGPYRVVKPLGHGGMGTVYLAERADQQYRQRVAIKIVHRHRASAELTDRFRAERQILANLEHPNIARLTDGGETSDGVPYLVMEYVDGVPLDRYCNQHSLTIAERLRLIRKVCDAVEYAHRNLVVHRDIKPSNILVTPDGEPKLLDFGIAKLLDAEAGPLHETIGEVRLMTPRNASPEQVRGDTITTATDVYALGVLMYLLLTGRYPFDGDQDRPYELERLICETEPSRPSSIVTRPVPATEGSEAHCPGISRKQLQGDLDNIVLAAMRKDASRRYASARQLGDDIGNYLEMRPVLARGAPAGYRLAKFLRRNAVATIATVLVVTLLTGMTTYYTLQLAAESERSRTQARIANRVTDFVVTLFDAANPARGNPAEITPRDLLDRGRDRIASELADAPAVRARLLGVLSEGYRVLGDYEVSRPMADESLAMLRDLYEDDEQPVALAKARVARHIMDNGEQAEAFSLYEEALASLRNDQEADPQSITTILNAYGSLARMMGDLDTAESAFREVLQVMDTRPGVNPRVRAHALANIGIVMGARSRPQERLEYLERAAAILEGDPATPAFELASAQLSLGNSYAEFGRFDEALAAFDNAYDAYAGTVGEDHQYMATLRLARSGALTSVGRIADAGADILSAIDIYESILPSDHPRVALAYHYLATHRWLQEQRLQEAYDLYARALAIYRLKLVSDHPNIVFAVNAMGAIRLDQGQLDAAEVLLDEALATATASLEPEHPQISYAEERLARLYHLRGDLQKSQEMFERSLEHVPRDGTYSAGLDERLERFARLLDDRGDEDGAAILRAEAARLETAD